MLGKIIRRHYNHRPCPLHEHIGAWEGAAQGVECVGGGVGGNQPQERQLHSDNKHQLLLRHLCGLEPKYIQQKNNKQVTRQRQRLISVEDGRERCSLIPNRCRVRHLPTIDKYRSSYHFFLQYIDTLPSPFLLQIRTPSSVVTPIRNHVTLISSDKFYGKDSTPLSSLTALTKSTQPSTSDDIDTNRNDIGSSSHHGSTIVENTGISTSSNYVNEEKDDNAENDGSSSSSSDSDSVIIDGGNSSSSSDDDEEDITIMKKKNRDDIDIALLPITFADISRAEVAIRGGVVRTSCERSHFISELVGSNVYFKNEFRQFTGSFKERGARNAILTLMRTKGSQLRGVIAASAGNHALALAYHGEKLGVPVCVVMPTTAPLAKVDKCRRFGARIIIHGQHIGEAKEHAETLVSLEGLDYVNGYDDPPILAGAGTIGMEIIDDVPDVDCVVVPVGGAGLIAGVSCAIKTLKPSSVVIGVEPQFCASYTAALQAGYPVPANFTPTLADGLAVPVVGSHAFEVARHYVDECVLTTEKEISLAVLRLLENEKVVVEGGGAAGLAALLPGGALDRADMKNITIVVPLCGGNIDTTVLGRVLDRGLAADQRLVQFIATVSDRPGGISKLTAIVAQEGASIKDIYHERAWLHSSVSQVQVKCVVELQGVEHGMRLKNALVSAGYQLRWNLEDHQQQHRRQKQQQLQYLQQQQDKSILPTTTNTTATSVSTSTMGSDSDSTSQISDDSNTKSGRNNSTESDAEHHSLLDADLLTRS